MNPIKQYMNAIERKLHLPWAVRRRIMTDLSGDVAARLEAGKTYEEVMAEMGSPEEVAEGFHAEFAGEKKSAGVWPWLFLAGAALCAASLLRQLILRRQMAASIGIIGGADGPTAIFIAGQIAFSAWPLLAGFLAAFLAARAGRAQSRDLALAAIWVSAGGLALYARELILAVLAGTLEGGIWGAVLWPQFWLPLVGLIISARFFKKLSK